MRERAMRIEMPAGELRLAYDALPAFPEEPGERRWYDRMRSFEAFVEDAPRFVGWIIGEDDQTRNRMRAAFPALFDLCLRACKPSVRRPPRSS